MTCLPVEAVLEVGEVVRVALLDVVPDPPERNSGAAERVRLLLLLLVVAFLVLFLLFLWSECSENSETVNTTLLFFWYKYQ